MGQKVTELNRLFQITSDDLFIIINAPGSTDNAESMKISVQDLLSRLPANTYINATLITDVLRVNTTWSPANSSAICTKGKIGFDSNYVYVATANNYVKRAALSEF